MRLSSALHSCIYLEPYKLSAVFQMLLNVALPRCPSVLEYSYAQIVSMLHLKEKEDIADEDEVKQLLQAGLEEDGDTIFTEQGYDGDTECSVAFDWKTELTLQEIILSLVQVIAQQEISAAELKQFLRLFQDNKQTTNSLLTTLLSVIEKHPVSPNSWAMFPAKTLVSSDNITVSADESEDSQDSSSEQAVWHRAAVEMDVQGIQWPPWPMGFTLAFWLSVDRYHCRCAQCCKIPASKMPGDRACKSHSETDEAAKITCPAQNLTYSECSLVVAIGNKEKMFEVWVHPKSASIICK
ncbi:lysosomal-trafficking regulator [Plakobranchus ocellatus]|uniref:Lysosomal-trafficking regulator n=1 Tax=Plakobranchus ocellatus TaxID=259542 RepID=A0AAV4CXF4_9GAST|nr:lysosomal-trafficking regulator [Plakobranchus ocellatus]